jgi:transcription antitermination protein NusB
VAARSKARKRALDILFESELRGLPTLELLSERQSVGDYPVQPYAAELVRGVATHSERIDALISWNLVDWTLERMPAVDRNILRIGVYEILWADDVPDSVAISEAVALAQDLSTDNSPPFVNGVLARIKADKPTISLDPELAPAPHPDDPDYELDDDEDEDSSDYGRDPFEDDAPPGAAPGKEAPVAEIPVEEAQIKEIPSADADAGNGAGAGLRPTAPRPAAHRDEAHGRRSRP